MSRYQTNRIRVRGACLVVCILAALPGASRAEDDPAAEKRRAGIEFFESHIRPLLIKRCHECHSSSSDPIEGGLRLDSRAGWERGGDSGAVIAPGKPNESRLLKAVLYQDPTLAMPPDNALSKREIELLRKWIELGAPDPRGAEEEVGPRAIDFKAGRRFWSFRPLSQPVLPEVKNAAWSQTPVDRFILARLEQRGLTPASPASRRVLIRRAYLDLLGLPPTLDEVRKFASDKSPDAWPKLVDRLLASPHYGERWGRHWLDVARYADDQLKTEYYYRDLPHAWRYRDWVVQAVNDDLPYDHFLLQQIAGDLLVDRFGARATAATGFLALGMTYQDDGGTPEGVAVAKSETLDDRVDTVTRGLLGLTVSCARCHDHKFDPIPTEDYYSLAGVFQNTKYVEGSPLVEPGVVKEFERARQAIAEVKEQIAAAEKAKEAEKVAELKRRLEELEQKSPGIYPRAHALAEGGDKDMRVALRGNLLKPGAVAPRRFLRILAGDQPPRFTQGSGRLELAAAIADPRNPLPARVIVNRIWQHHFGRGIVASASNFGSLGERPTHPRLLDWLASRLISSGWSLKQLHREILMSSTYQLSTLFDERNSAVDHGNVWLWRMNRRRLDVESIRDGLLRVVGELDTRIGGPTERDLLRSRRRTIYGSVRRDKQSESDEMLRLFDFPNPRISNSGRGTTTIPQQQLFMLNNPFVIARARALAARVAPVSKSSKKQIERSIQRVFQIVLSRDANAEEMQLTREFVDESPEPSAKLSAWEQFCQILMVSNEAMHRP